MCSLEIWFIVLKVADWPEGHRGHDGLIEQQVHVLTHGGSTLVSLFCLSQEQPF